MGTAAHNVVAAPVKMGKAAIIEAAGTTKIGTEARAGDGASGYRFGDWTRGIAAKGRLSRMGKEAKDGSQVRTGYRFGDITRGIFTRAVSANVTRGRHVEQCYQRQSLVRYVAMAIRVHFKLPESIALNILDLAFDDSVIVMNKLDDGDLDESQYYIRNIGESYETDEGQKLHSIRDVKLKLFEGLVESTTRLLQRREGY